MCDIILEYSQGKLNSLAPKLKQPTICLILSNIYIVFAQQRHVWAACCYATVAYGQYVLVSPEIGRLDFWTFHNDIQKRKLNHKILAVCFCFLHWWTNENLAASLRARSELSSTVNSFTISTAFAEFGNNYVIVLCFAGWFLLYKLFLSKFDYVQALLWGSHSEKDEAPRPRRRRRNVRRE